MTTTTPRCNGVHYPMAQFDASTLKALRAALARARASFNKECGRGTGYYKGMRFNSDAMGLDRICGASIGTNWADSRRPTEEEVLADLDGWAAAALEDCASADHWYMFEKDYGGDY